MDLHRDKGRLLLVLAAAMTTPVARAQEEVVEHYPDGQVRERYEIDEEGRKHGRYEAFHRDGTPRLEIDYLRGRRSGRYVEYRDDGEKRIRAVYRADRLHGRFEEFWPGGERHILASYREGKLHGSYRETSEDGEREERAHYDEGLLHGSRKFVVGHKTVSRQKWRHGRLVELDRMQPFPVPREELLATLAAILRPPAEPVDVSQDPLAAERAAALRRLQAYRYLCHVEHQGMELVPEWNELCDAAAEVCRQNGGLSHTPPKPPGMSDELYRKGALGARRSNLSAGGGMVNSVDSYMDDSDPSNIDRVGHRRWCLNPAMRRTAFGQGKDGRYSAMWSMDGSGGRPRDIDAVMYPPPGHVPVDFFGPRHAWSIAPLRGGSLRLDEVRVAIRALDEDWLVVGDPLPLDHLGVARAGYGAGPALVFRPEHLEVRPGARFLAEISTDGGRTLRWRYVVAFCGAE